jgi:hypothetical protein
MRFRKLRIAWSVGCGIACVLLIVLWVRSIQHDDVFPEQWKNPTIQIRSYRGTFEVTRWVSPSKWTMTPYAIIKIPYLVLTLITGAAAITPCVRWSKSFSLRTLLIATTLVAALLGFVVYMAKRKPRND